MAGPGIRRFRNERDQLDVLVSRVIERHRQEGEGGTTLLSMLMAASDPETGQGMTRPAAARRTAHVHRRRL